MADHGVWRSRLKLPSPCHLAVILMSLSIQAVTSENTLDKLAESFGSFLGSLTGGDECQYVCPNGSRPRKRPGHHPSSNGCGALGLQLDTSQVPDMTRCCNQHDLCYDTCNTDRDVCDLEFKECLENLCNERKKKMTNSEYKNCIGVMNVMYAGTMALGCAPYKEAQSQACICSRGTPEL